MKKLRALALGFLIIALTAFAANAPKATVLFYNVWNALDGKSDAVKELVENAVLNLLDSVTNFENMDLRFDIAKRFPVDEAITQAEAAAIAARIFGVEEEIIKRYHLMSSTFEDLKCKLETQFEKEKAEKPVIFDYSKLCAYHYFMQEFFRKNAGYTLFDNPDPMHKMTRGEFVKFLVRTFSLYAKVLGLERGADYVKIANELENRLRREYGLNTPNIGYITTFEFMFLTKDIVKGYFDEDLAGLKKPAKDTLVPIIKLDIFTKNNEFKPNDPAQRWWAYALTYYVFSKTPYIQKYASNYPYGGAEETWADWPFKPSAPTKDLLKEFIFTFPTPVLEEAGKIKVMDIEELEKMLKPTLEQYVKVYLSDGVKEKNEEAYSIATLENEAEYHRTMAMFFLAMALDYDNDKAFDLFKEYAKIASSDELYSFYESLAKKGSVDFPKADLIAKKYKELAGEKLFWDVKCEDEQLEKDHFSYKAYFAAKADEFKKKAETFYKLAEDMAKKANETGNEIYKLNAEAYAKKMANYLAISLIFEKASKLSEDKVKAYLEKIGGNALDIVLYKYYEDLVPIREVNNTIVYKSDEEVTAELYERLNKNLNATFVRKSDVPGDFQTSFEVYSIKGAEPLEFFLTRYFGLENAKISVVDPELKLGILSGKAMENKALKYDLALVDNTVVVDKIVINLIDNLKNEREFLSNKLAAAKNVAEKNKYEKAISKLDEYINNLESYVAGFTKVKEGKAIRVLFKDYVDGYLAKIKDWYEVFTEEPIEVSTGKVTKKDELISYLESKTYPRFVGNPYVVYYKNIDVLRNTYEILRDLTDKEIVSWIYDIYKWIVTDYKFNIKVEVVKDKTEYVRSGSKLLKFTLEYEDEKIKSGKKPTIVVYAADYEHAITSLVEKAKELGKKGVDKIVITLYDVEAYTKEMFDEIRNDVLNMTYSDLIKAIDKNAFAQITGILKLTILPTGDMSLEVSIRNPKLTGNKRAYISPIDAIWMIAFAGLEVGDMKDTFLKGIYVEGKMYPGKVLYNDIKALYLPTFDRLNYSRETATLGSIENFLDRFKNIKVELGEAVKSYYKETAKDYYSIDFYKYNGKPDSVSKADEKDFLGYWKKVYDAFKAAGYSNDTPIVGKVLLEKSDSKFTVKNTKEIRINLLAIFAGLLRSYEGAAKRFQVELFSGSPSEPAVVQFSDNTWTVLSELYTKVTATYFDKARIARIFYPFEEMEIPEKPVDKGFVKYTEKTISMFEAGDKPFWYTFYDDVRTLRSILVWLVYRMKQGIEGEDPNNDAFLIFAKEVERIRK